MLICPHCNKEFVTEDEQKDEYYFGSEYKAKDFIGRELTIRTGNCCHCYGVIDIVNGKVGKVMIVPVGFKRYSVN